MREIKFRSWYGNEFGYFSNGSYDEIFEFGNDTQQYTGLLDKNGAEIYEGDIVKKSKGDYKIGKVVYQFGMFCFHSIGYGVYAGSDAFTNIHSLHYKEYESYNNYEVIGNIYENPELM